MKIYRRGTFKLAHYARGRGAGNTYQGLKRDNFNKFQLKFIRITSVKDPCRGYKGSGAVKNGTSRGNASLLRNCKKIEESMRTQFTKYQPFLKFSIYENIVYRILNFPWRQIIDNHLQGSIFKFMLLDFACDSLKFSLYVMLC